MKINTALLMLFLLISGLAPYKSAGFVIKKESMFSVNQELITTDQYSYLRILSQQLDDNTPQLMKKHKAITTNSTKRHHFIICLVLILLIPLVYIADNYFLKPGTGGFIKLDFRGLFTSGYYLFVALHLIISTLGVYFFLKHSVLPIHVASAFTSIVLLCLYIFIYNKIGNNYNHKKHVDKAKERQETLYDVIKVKEWWFVPNSVDPEQVHVKVTVSESGRFAYGISASESGTYGEAIFHGKDTDQIQVKKGKEVMCIFQLVRVNEGQATDWEIRFNLFKDENGSASENISKIFINSSPERTDDGHFFYEQLPALKMDLE